jgi:DNA processing protein
MSSPVSAELRDSLTLHLVPGLGPRLTAALLERFGSARAVLQASATELREVPYVGSRVADAIRAAASHNETDAELGLLERHGVRLCVLGTPEYPAALAQLPDVPQLLYVRGTIEPADANAVALVGSRRCTAYGKRVTEKLAADLARAGYTIVSGLPRGTRLETRRSSRSSTVPLSNTDLCRTLP